MEKDGQIFIHHIQMIYVKFHRILKSTDLNNSFLVPGLWRVEKDQMGGVLCGPKWKISILLTVQSFCKSLILNMGSRGFQKSVKPPVNQAK